jgi:nucleotide-binding universal stress UspA family protein
MNDERRPVLVATDLLEGGQEAVRQADGWARKAERDLVVCHAIPDPIRLAPLFPQLGVEAAQLVMEAQQRLRIALTDKLDSELGRGSGAVELVIEPGSPHVVVLDAAKQVRAALVVVGATSKGKVARWLLGSTADQVLRHAPAPVLVARPSPSSGTLVVGSDLSESALPALKQAVAEARRRDARLVAVHCLDIAHPALSAFEPSVVLDDVTLQSIRDTTERVLRAALQRAGGNDADEVVVVDGAPARALIDAASERDAELLVVATHGRSGLARLALGSVAASVARDASCSVLVVPSG